MDDFSRKIHYKENQAPKEKSTLEVFIREQKAEAHRRLESFLKKKFTIPHINPLLLEARIREINEQIEHLEKEKDELYTQRIDSDPNTLYTKSKEEVEMILQIIQSKIDE
jgi:hypothetical protein